MLSRFVIAFLSASKHFFISWLQPLPTVNLRSWRLPKLSLNSWWLKNIWNTSASLVPSSSFIPLIHSPSATLTSCSSNTPKSISASGPLHILFPLAPMPFPMIFLWIFLLSSFQALGILQFNSKITLVHWFNKASPTQWTPLQWTNLLPHFISSRGASQHRTFTRVSCWFACQTLSYKLHEHLCI